MGNKPVLLEGYDLSVAFDGLVGQLVLRRHHYALVILAALYRRR